MNGDFRSLGRTGTGNQLQGVSLRQSTVTIAGMSLPKTVVGVRIPGSEYDISVGCGLIQSAGAMLRAISQSDKVMVLSDSQVGPLHRPALKQALESAGLRVIEASIPAGEEHKGLNTLLPVYDQFLSSHIDRQTPLLALGGGVVGDMGGFVAATILRGIPLIQIPTTLLAMVDASVGGKTGVNHAVGKNLIGAFHQPAAVWIDPAVLTTLPPRELHGGLAECIKHDIIRDANGFAQLEQNIHRALSLDLDYLQQLIAHNVAIKASVVAEDPFERGVRAHLNLGHTFGHALETVSGYAYSHGEAVALGMAAAAKLAQSLGLIDERSRLRINAVIAQAQLPTAGLKLNIDQVVEAMAFDKKIKSGRLRFVLPAPIGRAIIRDDVPAELVRDAVQSLA